MNMLREVVSGKKNRFKQQGYNLDLSYVTKRIIAMSFPGQGMTGLYRNPIDQVAQLLNTAHQDNYIVINLCGKKYDYKKFGEVFDEFLWEDHHSPALDTLFKICKLIHNYLSSNLENVVAIHCLAGKGRTGTVICCYLLYTGKFKSVQDVLYYYGKKRFMVEGLGVNQPCQLRYIEYFFKILTSNNNIYPIAVNLRNIRLVGKPPEINMGGGCKPFFTVTNVRNLREIYNSNSEKVHKYKSQNFIDISLKQVLPMSGDVLINFSNQGMISNEKMFRLAFNTAFIEPSDNNVLTFVITDLDPNQIQKDPRFQKEFTVIVEMEGCKKCNNHTPFQTMCDTCLGVIQSEIQCWKCIEEIMKQYKKPTKEETVELLFKDIKDDDVEAVLLSGQNGGNQEELETRIKSTTYSFQLEEVEQQEQQQQQQQQQRQHQQQNNQQINQ